MTAPTHDPSPFVPDPSRFATAFTIVTTLIETRYRLPVDVDDVPEARLRGGVGEGHLLRGRDREKRRRTDQDGEPHQPDAPRRRHQ